MTNNSNQHPTTTNNKPQPATTTNNNQQPTTTNNNQQPTTNNNINNNAIISLNIIVCCLFLLGLNKGSYEG
jgi:hypothetical protein